jgi:hypothetical protein
VGIIENDGGSEIAGFGGEWSREFLLIIYSINGTKDASLSCWFVIWPSPLDFLFEYTLQIDHIQLALPGRLGPPSP